MLQFKSLHIVIFFLCMLSTAVFSQITDSPCSPAELIPIDVSESADSKQSSTIGANGSSNALDGSHAESSVAETGYDENAWFEMNLGRPYTVESIKIWYPDSDPLESFYLLLSSYPFESENLAQTLASADVYYLYVENIESGGEIPLQFSGVSYIRIQNKEEGTLSLIEIDIPGNGEVCGNGTDDDCDGLIDCDDKDCSGWINEAASVKINPTCPICEDGQIHIYGSAYNQIFYPTPPPGTTVYNVTQYSIDNGQTWQYSRYFYNLDDGDYYAWIRNPVTGCLVEYENNPIELRSPPGDPQGECPNGDFENGDFTGWTGGIGTFCGEDNLLNNPSLEIDNENLDDPTATGSVHTIIQSSAQSDPNIPSLILTPPTGGTYFAKLGSELIPPGCKASKLTYCFTVDNDNKDFNFNFALVFQDPGDHKSSEKSFFRYRLYESGNPGSPFEQEKFNSEDDDFFIEHGSFLYRGWTCRAFDLSSRIGQEICVEFIATDCSLGCHFGYAYIDGLCTDGESQQPTGNISVNPIICPGADNFLVDGSNSVGENQYTWEVCSLTNPNGIEYLCESGTFIGEASLFNIEEFYTEKNGFFNCDQWYRVKLTVKNECGEGETVSENVYVDCPKEFDYQDVTYCTDSGPTPVVGTNNCNTCTYEWEAIDGGDPIAFDNPNAAFPNIINFPPGSGGSRTVAVTITDTETGCIYSDTATVKKYRHQPYVTLSYVDDYLCGNNNKTSCELLFLGSIYTPIAFEDLDIKFKNEDNGVVFDNIELVSTEIGGSPYYINRYNIRYILDGFANGVDDESTYKITVQLKELMNINTIGCMAEAQVEVGDLPYWGDIPLIYFPNAFSPNSVNNLNSEWIPLPPNGSGYNVSWYKLQIWHEWGGLLFEEEACAPTGGFNIGDISWDGTAANGQSLNTDWYIYIIYFENCNNKRPPTASQPFSGSSHPCPGDPSINCWYGEIYLLN